MLTEVEKLQSRGKGSPHQPQWNGRGGLMGHHNPPVSTDLSVVTVTGAASREKGTSPQGSKPSAVPQSVQAAEQAGSREAALPSATKSMGKVNHSPLCGTGSVAPLPPPHVTVQSLTASALLLSSLHREVWQHPDSGARAGSGCSLVPITPILPHLAPQESPPGSCCVPKTLTGGGPAGHSPPPLGFSQMGRGAARPSLCPWRAPVALACCFNLSFTSCFRAG